MLKFFKKDGKELINPADLPNENNGHKWDLANNRILDKNDNVLYENVSVSARDLKKFLKKLEKMSTKEMSTYLKV